MRRPLDVPSPQPAGEQREEGAVTGDDSVGEFAERREAREILICPERPAPGDGQRSADGFGRARDATVRFDEMDGRLELATGKLGELGGDGLLLERDVVDAFARGLLPARDPAPAERAIAVKDEQRLVRRTCDSRDGVHRASCSAGDGWWKASAIPQSRPGAINRSAAVSKTSRSRIQFPSRLKRSTRRSVPHSLRLAFSTVALRFMENVCLAEVRAAEVTRRILCNSDHFPPPHVGGYS
jgi:hypothetical protein